MSLRERYERLLYIGDSNNVIAKYVSGHKVFARENIKENIKQKHIINV